MENISYKGELVAILIRSYAHGSYPVTAPEEVLQMMTIKRDAGEKVSPHLHIPRERTTDHLSECLVIQKGKIKVSLYGDDAKPFTVFEVKAGEALYIRSGGHAVEYLEPTEMLEFKNGPYVDDKKAL